MTDYTDLQRDMKTLGDSFLGITDAQIRFNDRVTSDAESQWSAIAELRDEIHAVANRVEYLIRASTTEPAEVAAKIVTDANLGTLREVRRDD